MVDGVVVGGMVVPVGFVRIYIYSILFSWYRFIVYSVCPMAMSLFYLFTFSGERFRALGRREAASPSGAEQDCG